MAKVIRALTNEDGIELDEIIFFETENYIGIWNYSNGEFMVVDKEDREFSPYNISNFDSLQELDDEVYNKTEEHIIEVFDHRCTYNLSLKKI